MKYVRSIFVVFDVNIVPLVISIFASVIFFYPDQIIEIYRETSLDFLYHWTFQGLNLNIAIPGYADSKRVLQYFAIGPIALVFSLYVVCVFNISRTPRDKLEGGKFELIAVVISIALISGLPLLALASGIDSARVQLTGINTIEYERVSETFASGLLSVGIVNKIIEDSDIIISSFSRVFLVFFIISITYVVSRLRIYGDRTICLRNTEGIVFLLITISVPLFSVLVIIDPVYAPQAVGSLFVICIWLVLLLILFSATRYAGIKMQIPITFIVICYMMLLGYFNRNDNNHIRMLPQSGERSQTVLPQLRESFLAWLACRPDRKEFEAEGSKYPVYIVAVQGGGVYAAYHAASVLAGLHEQAPGFHHHLFAVSGVSGGSVGAALFSTTIAANDVEADRRPESEDCINRTNANASWLNRGGVSRVKLGVLDTVGKVLTHDLLSPLVAGLAVPDFLQRFLPWPCPTLDRSRRLEWALETAFRDELGTYQSGVTDGRETRTLLESSYMLHWHPQRSGPALILNTTDVATGERRVFAPFELGKKDQAIEANISWRVPLSTAAVLSARFPWITPAGWYEQPLTNEKVRLVDGGYFENSGLSTAAELFNSLKRINEVDLGGIVDLKLLILTSPKATEKPRRGHGLHEIRDPVRALLNTGFARALLAVETAETNINGSQDGNVCSRNFSGSVMKATLRELGYKLPLGWRWSDSSLLLVAAQKGRASIEFCAGAGVPTFSKKVFESDCMAWQVRCQLDRRGRPPMSPKLDGQK